MNADPRLLGALIDPARRWPRQLAAALVHGYRLFLRPWIGNRCRFEPSCSSYALQALDRHGALRGGALVGWRLLRCQPWCHGGCDAVPDRFDRSAFTGLFTRHLAGDDSAATNPGAATRNPS